MTLTELQYQAFRAMRRKVNRFDDKSSNEEIAGFVKCVCALERLFCIEGRHYTNLFTDGNPGNQGEI